MGRKAKTITSTSNSNPTDVKSYAAALAEHTDALRENSSAMTAALPAQAELTNALKNHTAALAATKPQKTLQEKIADAGDCMSQWLMRAKGVSKADSTTATKNMATDFHIGGQEEMQRCLEWVQGCLSGKGDIYQLDTTSSTANQHLTTLATGTLGAVISDIASNTT